MHGVANARTPKIQVVHRDGIQSHKSCHFTESESCSQHLAGNAASVQCRFRLGQNRSIRLSRMRCTPPPQGRTVHPPLPARPLRNATDQTSPADTSFAQDGPRSRPLRRPTSQVISLQRRKQALHYCRTAASVFLLYLRQVKPLPRRRPFRPNAVAQCALAAAACRPHDCAAKPSPLHTARTSQYQAEPHPSAIQRLPARCSNSPQSRPHRERQWTLALRSRRSLGTLHLEGKFPSSCQHGSPYRAVKRHDPPEAQAAINTTSPKTGSFSPTPRLMLNGCLRPSCRQTQCTKGYSAACWTIDRC